MNTREAKAQRLADSGQIVQSYAGFFVPSQSEAGHFYLVHTDDDGNLRCTCKYSSIHPDDPCCHVRAAALIAKRESIPGADFDGFTLPRGAAQR